MSFASLIKRLQDIMRKDSGVDGDAQRLAQIVWLIFLKVYDYQTKAGKAYDFNRGRCQLPWYMAIFYKQEGIPMGLTYKVDLNGL